MKGIVYKSTGIWYIVKDEKEAFWNARIKGIFKIDEITSTNPLAVGDEVEMEAEGESKKTALITAIGERRNYINRQAPSNKLQHHIIAANIDQSLMIATLKDPRTSQGFIDRFLVACEAYHVPAIVAINKADVYRKKEMDKYEEWQEMYQNVGYQILLFSVKTGQGMDQLRSMLQKKTTLISGHSGVGKSSFINAIIPAMQLKTQDISGWSGKGVHTTTFAEMIDLPEPQKGRIIDTPGIREFGLVDIGRQELSHYFPEMRDRLQDCQFNNCLHTNEPGCAIKKALEEGKIFVDRYISYCNILDSIDEKNYI
ncbi:MAG: ribosome small subunit-dependent GTPase A [Bacteroidetes bacterium]|nr:MAG: ribosome small subunit-dependent GTPase A [Bacteroidota bacterium]